MKTFGINVDNRNSLVFLALSTKEGIAGRLQEESGKAFLIRDPAYLALVPVASKVAGGAHASFRMVAAKMMGVNMKGHEDSVDTGIILLSKNAVLYVCPLTEEYLELYRSFIKDITEEHVDATGE